MIAATDHFLVSERAWLEGLYRRYHHRRFIDPDPLAVLAAYPDVHDREVAALIASALAYGNVKAMLPAIRGVLAALGPRPAAALRGASPRAITRRMRGFRYRFTTDRQLAALLVAIRRLITTSGGMQAPFAAAVRASDETTLPALTALVDALVAAAPFPPGHLLPDPRRGSACKRLNLFLRWMIRADEVDPGGWTDVAPRRLLVPLDTHVHRTALARGWTARRSADLRTALEVTALLRRIRPRDPLRYDFAITRPGIRGS